MSDNYINIDNYFQNQLSEEEKVDFENKLSTDATFAEKVAFYAHTKAIERENILQQRHTEWINLPQKKAAFLSFSKIAAGIAAMLVLVLSWLYLFQSKQTPEQLADVYIEQNLMILPLKMDVVEDSLELGKNLYNQNKYSDALSIFEKLIKREPKATEYAGLSAFQMKQYNLALTYFEKLEQNTDLLENKGKFYKALTNLKQGDEKRGKAILQEIIDNNLYGKKEAEKILK